MVGKWAVIWEIEGWPEGVGERFGCFRVRVFGGFWRWDQRPLRKKEERLRLELYHGVVDTV